MNNIVNELPNEEQTLVDWLNAASVKKLTSLVYSEYAEEIHALLQVQPLTCLLDIQGVFEDMDFTPHVANEMAGELVDSLYEQLLTKYSKRLGEKLNKFRNRTANRATYVREPILMYYQVKDKDGNPTGQWRWKYDRVLRSFGLLAQVVNHTLGYQGEPTAMGVLVEGPPADADDEEKAVAEEQKKLAAASMVKAGVSLSGYRLGWNRNSPGWDILKGTFPSAVDMSAYCHSLNAPVLPEGFIANANVTFRALTVGEKDLQTDGSGIYHPDTPELQSFIAKYGLVAFQLRVLRAQGDKSLFAKGIVFPSELALVDGKPALCMDLNQIKARFKNWSKKTRPKREEHTFTGCFVGALQAWNRTGKMSGSFELLENIQSNPRTREIVAKLVGESMDVLESQGLTGLVKDVGKKDPIIGLMNQLVEVGNQNGLTTLHPWHVPKISSAIKQRLARRLYIASQGAGIKAPSAVGRMDSHILPGTCVVSNRDGSWMKPGQRVVAWRFPIIMPSGLLELTTVNPPEHLLVNGKMSPHTIVLSIPDTAAGQADDDGDQWAVSNSPDLVELFTHKLDQLKLGIEPEGIMRKDSKGNALQSDSDEGLAYLVEDHRGPVGWCTVQRSRLLAVGDELGARAMSIWIQECVDKAKRLPKWSDARKAVNMNNWTNENGVLKFNIKFSDDETPGGEFPMALIRSWVNGRIIAAGCTRITYDSAGQEMTKARDPLWWRTLGKRIDVDQWNVPELETKYENLVHWAARCTHERWEQFKTVFAIPETGEVGMGALLPLVMRAKGIDARVIPQTERSYTQLKAKSGLSAYNAKLYTILGSKSEDHVDVEDLTDLEAKERQRAINTAQADLEETIISKFTSGELTVNEILTLWVHECSPTGKVNSAFRLVCFENSPILDILGIAEATKCKFLGKGNRADRIITQSLESADPFEAMKNIILTSRVHALGHGSEKPYLDEAGKPMELHECVDCMTTLQDGLVRTLRTRKDSREKAYLTDLRQRMTDILASQEANLEGPKKEVSKAEMLAWEGTFLKGET